MQLPIVNLNGTSLASLQTQYETAHEAVRGAITALHAIEVHGRDYPQGGAQTAISEHGERIRKLRAVEREIEDIRLHLHIEHQRRQR